MGYIAFASAKGSPGVTTALAALAATWPADRELLVVEVDPAGGDLVVRFELATEPGLVSLAAAGRRELAPDTLLAHTQEVAGLAAAVEARPRRVLVAPVSADQAGAALTALRGALSSTLAALEVDVLVDCGRLDPHSPAFEVATKADLLVMVAQPVVAEVHHLTSRVAGVGAATAVSVLLVGDRPYSVSEVAEAVGVNPLGTLPADSRSAAALAGGLANAPRGLRRSPLLREAGAIAAGLADWLGPAPAGASGGAIVDAPTLAAPPPGSLGHTAPTAPAAPPGGPPLPPLQPSTAPRPSPAAPPPAGDLAGSPPAAPPLAPPTAPPVRLPPPADEPPAAPPPPVTPPGGPPLSPSAAPSAPPAHPAPPPPAAVGASDERPPDGFARLRANVRRERAPGRPAKHFRRDDAEERRR